MDELIKTVDVEIVDTKEPEVVNSQASNIPVVHFNDCDTDLIDFWLSGKSQTSIKGYSDDLRLFTQTMEIGLSEFLALDQVTGLRLVIMYIKGLKKDGLLPATRNRRLASIKSVVKFARSLNKSVINLDTISIAKNTKYRDTKGVSIDVLSSLMAAIDSGLTSDKEIDKIKATRDKAIFGLLIQNALRRSEVASIRVKNIALDENTIYIYGKGHSDDKQKISITDTVKKYIEDWMIYGLYNEFLFVGLKSVKNKSKGISSDTIYDLTEKYFKDIGITKKMSPHRIRHSSITACLDLSNGDLKATQQLSRHKNLDTLMIYYDNLQGIQGEMSNLLDVNLSG
jgi:integrase/recombinase XerC